MQDTTIWSDWLGRGGIRAAEHRIAQSLRTCNEIRLRGQIDPLPRVVTREQVDRLIAACQLIRDKLLVSLLFATGARIAKALGMRHHGRRRR